MSIATRLLPTLTALALLAVGRDARAQGETVLRDAELPAFLAVLRADVARAGVMEREVPAVARQIQADLKATLETAAGDPLAHVRERTAHFIVPPDARYDAGCSRAASAATMIPRAVYAIGRADDATAATLQAKGTTELTNKEAFALMMRQAGGSAGQAQAATLKWYQARGFRIEGPVAEMGVLRWNGAKRDPLTVAVHMTNIAASLGGGCERLGNTALLVLTIDEPSALAGSGASGARAVAQVDAGFEATLARTGMSKDRYVALLGAAWQAQKELQEPDEAEQTDAMAKIPEMRAMGEARRQNRAWLERHRDQLLPLLEQYGRSLGGGR